MFDFDKWQEIYNTLSRHKLRTALTAFGVFWGIFMLVVLLGAGNGLSNGVMRGFSGIDVNSFFVWGQTTTQPYRGLKAGRRVLLTNDDTKAIVANVNEVEYVAPRLQFGTLEASYQKKHGFFNINGDYPELTFIQPKPMISGRFINWADMNQIRKVAVIGRLVAEQLFGKDVDPLGRYFSIRGVYFQVVGVFGTKQTGEDGDQDLKTIFLPFFTMQRIFNMPNQVHYYSISVKQGIPASIAESKVKLIIAKQHNISPDDKVAVGSFNLEQNYNQINGLFTGINIFLGIVGVGTLVAGIVGVSNIMLITVQERTREIGVRKAIGATPWSIISMIMQESIVLTFLSGYSGLVAGVALTEGINYFMVSRNVKNDFFYNPTIDFTLAAGAVILLVFAGTLAGLIPSGRASSIQPIEALRAD